MNAPYEWGATDAALKNMAAGSYTLKAVATDNAGHTSETSIGIKVVEGNINGKTVILTPIHDAFIQGAVGTNSNDLKVESGNRVSYLMFDLSAISGSIETAELSITVGADNGDGEFVVYLGNGTNWTETTLSSSNAPAQGVALASLNGTFEKGLTYQWPLNAASRHRQAARGDGRRHRWRGRLRPRLRARPRGRGGALRAAARRWLSRER